MSVRQTPQRQRLVARPGRALRRAARFVHRHAQSVPRRTRKGLGIFFALAAAFFVFYAFWLRDSAIVRVEHVTISGITIKDQGPLRAALTQAALRMTVLHVRTDALVRAAAPWHTVRSIEASATVPHNLHLRVIEYQPAAVAVGPDRRPVAITADGSLLGGFPVDRPLPVLVLAEPPQPPRLRAPDAQALVMILDQTPPQLGPRLTQLAQSPDRGVVVSLARAPDIVFGDGTDTAIKWQAALRVLADPASFGARYVDVSLPQRPVAGGFGPPSSG